MISGTPASAFETGQPRLAASAWPAGTPSASMPGTRPATSSAILVIPSPGWNVTVAEVASSLGRRAGLREPVRERHREAGACAAAISSSGLVLPVGSSARDGPADVERRRRRRWPRSRSCRRPHQGAVPGHFALRSVAIGYSSFESARRRKPLRSPGSAPRSGQPSSASRATRSSNSRVDTWHPRRACDRGRDDPVRPPSTSSIVTVHRDVDVAPAACRRAPARSRATWRNRRRAPRRAAPPGSSSPRVRSMREASEYRQLGERAGRAAVSVAAPAGDVAFPGRRRPRGRCTLAVYAITSSVALTPCDPRPLASVEHAALP